VSRASSERVLREASSERCSGRQAVSRASSERVLREASSEPPDSRQNRRVPCKGGLFNHNRKSRVLVLCANRHFACHKEGFG